MFTLDSRLNNDTIFIESLSLCDALLMNDARYPWVILVPRIENAKEIYELTDLQQNRLMIESNSVAKLLAELTQADKMNVAALGNVVAQLHIHHVARYGTDEAWPAPVWGKGTAIPYTDLERDALIEKLKQAFQGLK
jgi:diadenosine tetraphosphate (Ap4A) HIT family hydrolase